MSQPLRLKNDSQKKIDRIFEGLLRSGRHSRWTLWSDFVTMSACTVSLADAEQREKRRRLYDDTAKRYTGEEIGQLSEMFAEVVNALEDDPEQDVLGELFMRLELSNDRKGQFFTPYSVCRMMAAMSAGNLKAEIEEKGYVSVNDCCCGAGALLIAFANEALRLGVNYQQHVLFVAQDVDFTAAMMCYIQLSLLGCPGYVIVGNTLTTPPTEPLTDQNVWYTPLYFLDVWHWRRVWKQMDRLCRVETAEKGGNAPEQSQLPPPAFTETKGGQLALF